MRRLMSIGTAVIMTLSVTACANRNRNLTYDGTQPQTITEQQITPKYATPMSTRTYKDGVYKSEGNKTTTGNEIASVTISNGRITGVDLASVDNNGAVKNTGMSGVNGTGGTVGGTTNPNGNPVITGTTTTDGTTGLTGTGPNGGIVTDTRTIDGVGTTDGTSTVRAIDRVRTSLITSIIQNQTYNIDTTSITNDDTLKSSVDNWKLAVQRALDKASQ